MPERGICDQLVSLEMSSNAYRHSRGDGADQACGPMTLAARPAVARNISDTKHCNQIVAELW